MRQGDIEENREGIFFLALSDPDLKDANILHAIYALAIKHRLDPSSMDDVAEGEVERLAPSIKTRGKAKKNRRAE